MACLNAEAMKNADAWKIVKYSWLRVYYVLETLETNALGQMNSISFT